MKKFFMTLVAVVMVFAMAVPAFADSAVKSIEQKAVTVSDTKAVDADGQEVAGATVEVVTTAESDETLNTALKAVKAATDVTAIYSDFLKEVPANSKAADYAVTDIFEVKVTGADKVSFSVATTLAETDPVVVLVYDGTTWTKVDANIQGSKIVVANAPAGVYAIISEAAANQGTSPQTGDMSTGILAAMAITAALACCVGACLIVDKKRA